MRVFVAGGTGVIGRSLTRRSQPLTGLAGLAGLAGLSDLRHFDRTFAVTNQLRSRGTDYLLEAARAAGTRRFIAQSFTGWPNQPTGGPVKTEDDPLDPHPPATMTQSLAYPTWRQGFASGLGLPAAAPATTAIRAA